MLFFAHFDRYGIWETSDVEYDMAMLMCVMAVKTIQYIHEDNGLAV